MSNYFKLTHCGFMSFLFGQLRQLLSHIVYRVAQKTRPMGENTASVVYSNCTNRFEHHTVAVFSLGGATAR